MITRALYIIYNYYNQVLIYLLINYNIIEITTHFLLKLYFKKSSLITLCYNFFLIYFYTYVISTLVSNRPSVLTSAHSFIMQFFIIILYR